MSFTKRRVLQTIGGSVPAALAGCAGFLNKPSPIYLDVQNKSSKSHHIGVEFEEDGNAFFTHKTVLGDGKDIRYPKAIKHPKKGSDYLFNAYLLDDDISKTIHFHAGKGTRLRGIKVTFGDKTKVSIEKIQK